MKKITLFAVLALAFGIFGFNNDANAQTSPVLYFCESYGSYGEIAWCISLTQKVKVHAECRKDNGLYTKNKIVEAFTIKVSNKDTF